MIWFVKYFLSKIISFSLLPLYLFPINKKKVLFISYGGAQYSCNPKYISEYLQYNYKGKYKLIWVFKNPEDFNFLDSSIEKVKYLSFMHFYHVITSQVCITNMGFNKFFFVRNSQRFIQTWHGGGAYKKSGKTLDKNFFQYLLNRQHDDMVTDFISSSQYFTDYFIRDLSYKNNILNIGMPRNSFILKHNDNLILKNSIKRRIDDSYDTNKFYILYAPTWRDKQSSYELPDFTKISNLLKDKIGKEIIILFRSHHFHSININQFSKNCIDVTNYPDMQELLLISDMLISDYSSCIWDFSLLYKPCFLYTPDLSKYDNCRGFYVDIFKWGFPVCVDRNSLENEIEFFNEEMYRAGINSMHKRFCSFERIDSCEQLINEIGLL
ncbi:CDP-glycerol glycerophosphotransferase family protein [Actinobacillus equuli]|uniref:CDP-glycerol glycerophosphotransferase family protein n=1 Tax=Actinobacillus equuli TaxID=718 RepID=UPI002441BE6F|nr:CDP-glycerol glycerophosphotransferase family protein [Actinobacillus equuli]WGE65245.1 CDP-glycerol glycerophosphotransferase family protein [Actinobacillus equuli subsp. equuli]WGE79227.1 CDP-glycerol glycerophosphotransferase family protein [Actinobacillus equuli subsp. equuli]